MKQITIIGAGPTGLAVLKTCLDAPETKTGAWNVSLYEQGSSLGGIWQPETLYDSLTTNLPHPLMAFDDWPFPPSTNLFPRAPAVRAYLQSYANHFNLLPHIHFNAKVLDARWDPPNSRWVITTSTGNHKADLLFVCNGHYHKARYPAINGLDLWLGSPGLVSHSQDYLHPLPAHGSTPLVIGGGPSGQDISNDLLDAPFIQQVINSASSPRTPHSNPRLVQKPRPTKFLSDFKTIIFQDGSRETVTHCILATGYEFDFPFFDESSTILTPSFPSRAAATSSKLYNTTYSVFPLWKHLLPFPATSQQPHDPPFPPGRLAFIALLVRVIPWPLALSQTRMTLAAFRQPSDADWAQGRAEVIRRWDDLASANPSDHDPRDVLKPWHRFEPVEQFIYRDELDSLADMLNGQDGPIGRRVKEWETTVYLQKDLLRRTWRFIEASGKADEWVEGVGEGGDDFEWVDLMYRVLRFGEEQERIGPTK